MARIKIEKHWNKVEHKKIVHGPVVRRAIPKIKSNNMQAAVRNAISTFKATKQNNVDVKRKTQGLKSKHRGR